MDRLVVVGDGEVELALAFPCVAAAVVRALVGPIDLQCLVELDDGAIEILLQEVADATVVIGRGLRIIRGLAGLQNPRAGRDLQGRIGHLLAIRSVLRRQRRGRRGQQRQDGGGRNIKNGSHAISPRRKIRRKTMADGMAL